MINSDLKKFQKLLKNKYLSNTLKTINILHPVKLHETYLGKNTNFFYLFKKIIKFLIFHLINLISLLDFFNYSKDYNYKKKKILIVSHLTNLDQLKNRTDPYFGNTSAKLKLKKIKFSRILINHTENDITPNLFYKKLNKIILPNKLSPKFELSVL